MISPGRDARGPWLVALKARRWLSPGTFELELERPQGFAFHAGQRIRLIVDAGERDYSLASGPGDSALALCIRLVSGGAVSTALAGMPVGRRLALRGPFGHFLYRATEGPVVFVAAGTGIAPFVSMARAGVSGFTLLHGARREGELHYAESLRRAARLYVACLSRTGEDPPEGGGEGEAASPAPEDGAGPHGGVTRGGTGAVRGAEEIPPGPRATEPSFQGRVTDYLAARLPPGRYDFYLCGGTEMIHRATLLADERFPGSRVFAEAFF